ncbi:MAG: hypothetical protein A3D64_01505 [Candidatus Wildermuthbacteria bacterium RIFCSPHIGHO2_02_FULL_49_9]|uniref:Uncharacterized protein n=2 Tax=Candidatus Wildermuthiibacteriota TaxID=1817923 RepID=A0A1G2QXA3_9BACT|nr:MAG: hypothetical protein A2672_01065 [Candidatus Wildermuthbacteria bacterium RIFCSPHIGHO2_01_FULL_49_22b]OHA71318.1 MAG: hypothetical protein A3D64_01505 [Candidatus Wildermuthbacteria bacterium RIFCSPHIGHO2_02_FULL_49_9]
MITQIVTHGSPAHLDELAGAIQLQDYGEEKLPGVNTATFRCLQSGENVLELAQREDTVLLGLGAQFRNEGNAHRIFDEHVANGDTSQSRECAATLVAKFVGIDQEFRWKKILKAILHTDRNPPNLTLDLSVTVMEMQFQGWALCAVLQETRKTLDVHLRKADQFAAVSLLPMKEEELNLNGERHILTTIEGDDPKAPAFARFLGASVVVVRNSSGHVQVLTANHLCLDMRDVIRALRLREQWIQQKVRVTDWRFLEQEGVIEEVPEWFWHKDSNNILNGGRSRPDAPPTKIPLGIIVETVKMCLETNRFEPSRQQKCEQGVCTSTPRKPCPLYNLGLVRCRTVRAIRANAYQASR